MLKFKGNGVFGAVAVGKICIYKRQEIKVRRERAADVPSELARLENAKRTALSQLREIYDKALREVGETNARIFEIHMMMLEDEDFNDAIAEKIKNEGVSAQYAAAVAADNFAQMFSEMDGYMSARAADVKDAANRLIACLDNSDAQNAPTDGEGLIICADDLAPSETVTLDKNKVVAFVTAFGSSNSHTAILARNMNIPAIIGVGAEFLSQIKDGEIAAADGHTGELITSPDAKTLSYFQEKQRAEQEQRALLQNLLGKDNVTLDGRRIDIFANIGSADNIGAVLLNDAGGIGLFRSEFLYLERSDYPSENEQFSVYKRVLESMGNKRVIIRTLDIGADKRAEYLHLAKEENPALGLRAIRLCLERQDVFRTQLRALFRASIYGRLGIMFPMITSTDELSQIMALCGEVKKQLSKDGIEFSSAVELGIMIETPAAALISDKLAPMVDFFSVGTNDLTQYTLACDRQNPAVERFFCAHHEAVLRLIEYSAQNAHKHGKWIGICGELAADAALTERFLKMGIDELSVSPPFVLKLREKVRSLDLSKSEP